MSEDQERYFTAYAMGDVKGLNQAKEILDEVSSEMLSASQLDEEWEAKLAAASNLIYDFLGEDRSDLSERGSINKHM